MTRAFSGTPSTPRHRSSAGRGVRALRRGIPLLLVAALLTACGIPTNGDPSTVPTGDVPYGLLDGTTPNPTPSTTPGVPLATSTIYLADTNQKLVAVPVQVTEGSISPLLQTLLNRLALGPGDRERQRGLVTDLSPGSVIILHSVASGRATIEVQSTSQDPVPAKQPVAIGQIVLTATSIAGIKEVLFLKGGLVVSVPGPTGEPTSDPLTAADYASLQAPNQDPVTQTVPLDTPSTSTTTNSP